MAPQSVVEVLTRHGLAADEAALAAEVEAALGRFMVVAGVAPLTDAEVTALRSGGLDFDSQGAYDKAMRRTVADFVSLLASALSVQAVAEMLHRTRPRVQQMISAGELWALRDTRGHWRLPAVQFAEKRPLPGLRDVVRALPADAHPLEIADFLSTPQPDLELGGRVVSPHEWLASGGEPADVVALAAALHAFA